MIPLEPPSNGQSSCDVSPLVAKGRCQITSRKEFSDPSKQGVHAMFQLAHRILTAVSRGRRAPPTRGDAAFAVLSTSGDRQ